MYFATETSLDQARSKTGVFSILPRPSPAGVSSAAWRSASAVAPNPSSVPRGHKRPFAESLFCHICDIRGRLANRPEFPPAGSRQELISFRTPNTAKILDSELSKVVATRLRE